MQILFVASEVAPFSKTGGLGDVAGALPTALAARGHSVHVVTPRYGSIEPGAHGLRRLESTVRARGEPAGLWEARLGRARVYLVEHDRYFGGRSGIYNEHGRDYLDNAQRFAFLSRAALDVPRALHFEPDVVHLNDWQTALGAWMLRHEHRERWVHRARTVYTIHNLAYQGVFSKDVLPAIGLPWEFFRYEALEFYDQLNFMKAGIVFSDAITTVSPSYAREILTPEHGWALDSLLRHRAGDLYGILNGIDEEWNPSVDRYLAAQYDAHALDGKRLGKAALQREMGLPVREDIPILASVGRLADQKGIALLAAILPDLMRLDLQLVLLGSGRHEYEELFRGAAREHPERLAVRIGFDEGLAHRIEAGADAFVMPSRFEPCGLNQMYSLRYGTIPIVRAVGGLDDTVEDYDGYRSGTGFKFRDYNPGALLTVIRRALDIHRDERAWRGLQLRGMAEDHSWAKSAERYEELFARLLA
jgi:starch synthase